MKVLKKIILWTLLVLCSLVIISLGIILISEKDNLTRDDFLSTLAVFLMFIPIEVGLLLELNFLGLKNKIPFIKSSKARNHILIWSVIFAISLISVICCYSNVSEEYKDKLTAESTSAELTSTNQTTTKYTDSTAQLIPSTTLATTVVLQPDKNEIISDENPLVFYYDDANYTVGDCSFSIDEISVVSQGSSKKNATNIYRIYGKVKNNSSETTEFTTTKYNSFIVGSYFEGDKEVNIGYNSHTKWKSDKESQKFSQYYSLAPGEEREFAVQALYTGSPKTYDYALEDVVFYFCNNDDLMEISFE